MLPRLQTKQVSDLSSVAFHNEYYTSQMLTTYKGDNSLGVLNQMFLLCHLILMYGGCTAGSIR